MIYEEIAAGRLIARKIGRRTIVRRADALAWLRSLPRLSPGDNEEVADSKRSGPTKSPHQDEQHAAAPIEDRNSGRQEARLFNAAGWAEVSPRCNTGWAQ
jgi:hypothetical protein